MALHRHPVINWCVTSAALVFLWINGHLPLSAVRAFGKILAVFVYHCVPRVKRIGFHNLDLAYGDTLPRAEKKRILKAACANMCTVGVELAHAPSLGTEEGKKLFRFEPAENIDLDKSMLLVGAHLGNWEWLASGFATMDYPCSVVVRPLTDPRLNAALERMRLSTGITAIDKTNAAPTVIRMLRDYTFVGILIDQNPRENGVPVTFFGQKTWATVAPAMIAIRTKVPIHPMTMIRGDDGIYTIKFYDPIPIQRSGNLRDDLVQITQACQDVIEAQIRERPEQWLWMHNRFKPRPKLEREWAAREAKDKPATNPDIF